MPSRLTRLHLFVAAVLVAAVISLVTAATASGTAGLFGANPLTYLLLTSILLLGELKPLKYVRRHNGGEATATWMISVALLLSVPVITALVTTAVASALAEALRRRPPLRVLFNAAQIVVSMALCALVLEVSGQREGLLGGADISLAWLPVALAAVVTLFVTNSLLTCVAIALSTEVPVRSLLRQSLTLNMATDGMLLALAPILVVVAERGIVLVPLLLITAFAVHESATLALERQHAATHDRLTGVANRWLFADHATTALLEADRRGYAMGVAVVDLDGFKAVNDTLGHHVGDEVLRQVAARFEEAIRGHDLVARFGGDEFAVLLGRLDDVDAARGIAERLHAAVAQPVDVEGLPVAVGASFGVAVYPDHGRDLDELLQRADVAMYAAKGAGGGVTVHDSGHAVRHGRLTLLRDVPDGLARGEFLVHYQPLLELATGRIRSVEALIRWHHPQHGLVPPSDFIPLLETTEHLAPLTRFVLEESVRQVAEWRRAGVDVRVAVNGSATTLQDPHLPGQIRELLRQHGVEPSALVLELTEHSLLESGGPAESVLTELRALGIGLAVDDFGTGYSSLTYLRQVPADTIKIDRSFISHMSTSPKDAAIVRAVIELAHTLGLQTVAEGIEDERVLAELRELGCDYAQGYFIARPLPAEQVLPHLRQPLSRTTALEVAA